MKLWKYAWPVLALAAVALIVIGAARGEYDSINRWGHTLCTACIGLGR